MRTDPGLQCALPRMRMSMQRERPKIKGTKGELMKFAAHNR